MKVDKRSVYSVINLSFDDIINTNEINTNKKIAINEAITINSLLYGFDIVFAKLKALISFSVYLILIFNFFSIAAPHKIICFV